MGRGTTVMWRTRGDAGPDGGMRIYDEGVRFGRGRRWWCGGPSIWTERHPNKKNRRRVIGVIELRFFGEHIGNSDDAFMGARDLGVILAQLGAWTKTYGVEWDLLFSAEFKNARILATGVDEEARVVQRAWEREGETTGDEIVDGERAASLLRAHGDRYQRLEAIGKLTGGIRTGAIVSRIRDVREWIELTPEPASDALETAVKNTAGDGERRLGIWTATTTTDARALADRALVEKNLGPLEDKWLPIDRAKGEELVDLWLRFSGNQSAENDTAAAQFWAQFDDKAQVLTNVADTADTARRQAAVGGYGIDVALAVVEVDKEQPRVGLFWFGVED